MCVVCGAEWVRRRRTLGWRPAWARWGAAEHFHVAVVVMLLLLNYSGVTLGEVGRLWLQFMPFIAILAAAELVERARGSAWPVAAVLSLQMATAIVLKLRMGWM